jgi:hypothetical protein
VAHFSHAPLSFVSGLFDLLHTILDRSVVPNKESELIEDGSNIFQPYIVKKLSNGERVGVCGITTKTKTEQSSSPDLGTTLRLESIAAAECTQNLTSLGLNKINDAHWVLDGSGSDSANPQC